jgi:DNA polymerase III delta prime subunit
MTAMHNPFSTICGHQLQVSALQVMSNSGAVPHALLFSGPEAVGKKVVARSFATALFQHFATSSQQVNHAELVTNASHPDLHWVIRDEEKKDISVDAVRELSSKLRLSPYYGGCAVAIIDDAHRLSLAACNALLMTLEEPNDNRFLILVTHSPHRLLETVLSRCQQINFGPLKKEEIGLLLSKIVGREDLSENELVSLKALAGESLSALFISNYFNSKSGLVENREELLQHLKNLGQLLDEIEGRFSSLFSKRQSSAELLDAAMMLSAYQDNADIFWAILYQKVRDKLSTQSGESSLAWSEFLSNAIECERMIKERNLNKELQLSSLFLSMPAAS